MTYEINKPQTNWVTYTIDSVAYELSPEIVNGVEQCLSEADALDRATEKKNWNNASGDRKISQIKQIRNQKLQETDFYALSDVTMSSEMSTYRQNLRNIPQDYTTEDEYDLLLARDEQGKLTHTVWEKP
tara:strand:- start:670 stop:1056 length:387 start_codon:yes stop_codon:yes gene_type:complete